jgi:uncharacterized protein YjbI with pentapeptide repeats
MTSVVPITTGMVLDKLSRQKFYNADFSDMDLSRRKLRQSLFYQCKFDRANMSEADCEGSDFFGSSFVDTVCYRTNFKDAKLANTKFLPKDAFGITLTMQCKTFDGMHVSQNYFYAWLIFATMMKPDKFPVQEDLLNSLVVAIGPERYVKLKALFTKREM